MQSISEEGNRVRDLPYQWPPIVFALPRWGGTLLAGCKIRRGLEDVVLEREEEEDSMRG